MTRKVVFLDMDGPMQSLRSAMSGFPFDPVGVHAVNEFIQSPGVEVVICSTVRKLCDSVKGAHVRLGKYGLRGITFHERWRTGGSLPERTDEVAAWMELYREPDVDYYAIDDELIDVDGVVHIKADQNGIPHRCMLYMKCVAGIIGWHEFESWDEWYATHQPHMINTPLPVKK